MISGIDTGNRILTSEEVEQISNQIINVLAQHRLSYIASKCLLDVTNDRLGQECFLKISSD